MTLPAAQRVAPDSTSAVHAAQTAPPSVSNRGSSHDAQLLGPKREFLTFRLGGEEYGIDILRVQEIRSYEDATRIAHAPPFLKGVVNLRGVIVPVVDLRIKFGCSEVAYNDFTVVIVLNVRGRVVGAVVDSVSDVLELPEAHIKSAPEMNNTAVDAAYVTGIASVGERMLIIMDIQALMLSPDMSLTDAQL